MEAVIFNSSNLSERLIRITGTVIRILINHDPN